MIKHFVVGILFLFCFFPLIDDSFAKTDPPELEKITFIDYSSPTHFGKQCDDGKITDNYSFFKSNIKWRTFPVSYSFDQSTPQDQTRQEISTAFNTWDDLYDNDFFVQNPSSRNVIQFSPIDGQGNVVAVTTMYYSPAEKKFTRFVVTFDSDEVWGIGTPESIGFDGAGFFDLQDVAAHEVGHVVGLGHVNSPKDCMLTLFKYVEEGETIKRTLDQLSGDILGFEDLYG